MKLNCSKFFFRPYAFILLAIIVLLQGCSEFYSYQPPAPVYGRPVVTNPYEQQVEIDSPVEERLERLEQEALTGLEQKNEPILKINTPEVKKPMSPAVIALMAEADANSKSGDLESAVVTIERALRIDSRNATLTYKLAQLRLKQSKPRLAEDLAKKAALLASNDNALKKKSWLLISEARRQQKNYYGAKEAKLKADSL